MSGFAEYLPETPSHVPLNAVVRPARIADVDSIMRVQFRAERQAHRDSLRLAIAAPDRCVLVAELGQNNEPPDVIGWAQTTHHTTQTDAAPLGHYLGGVTVVPEYRRRGVGSALTSARMSWISALAGEAFYIVNPQNRASIDLHRRWGFEELMRADVLTGVTFSGGIGLLMRASLGDAGPALIV